MNNKWASEYFTWAEIQCRGSGQIRMPRTPAEELAFWGLLTIADEVRREFGYPLVCRSGHRSAYHNIRIGGALRSMHTQLLALDLAPRRRDWPDHGDEVAYDLAMARLCEIIDGQNDQQNQGLSIGLYQTFIHIDKRTALGKPQAQWEDNRTWTRYERHQRPA